MGVPVYLRVDPYFYRWTRIQVFQKYGSIRIGAFDPLGTSEAVTASV